MKQTMEQLQQECLQCQRCDLCKTRTNVVFGTGSQTAPIMLIGEGPGENEDLQGIPFVGRAGQLLDKMLDAVGLSREREVYITNMVKCRPPHNRDPLPEETQQCLGYLRGQVAVMRPKLIVCLGRIAAIRLLREDFKVTKEHGQWMLKNGTWMMGTFHPAALLRNPGNKPAAMEDFLSLRAKLQEVCPEWQPE